MNLKRWSIPVERAYAPTHTGGGPRVLRAERQVDLVEENGRLRVYVDGRLVVHREQEGRLIFGIGKYGCMIVREIDDFELFVGGKRIDDMPSIMPVALFTDPPPAPPASERGPIRLQVSSRVIALVVAFLVVVSVWKTRGVVWGKPTPWDPSWQAHAAVDGGYSTQLPGAAKTTVETRTENALTLELHTSASELHDLAAFGVVWADIPTETNGSLPLSERDVVSMCTMAMNAFVARSGKVVPSPVEAHVASSNVTYDSAGVGCNLDVTIKRSWRFGDLLSPRPDSLYARGMLAEVHGTIVGRRLFVRIAVTDPEHANGPDVQRFFQAFALDAAAQ